MDASQSQPRRGLRPSHPRAPSLPLSSGPSSPRTTSQSANTSASPAAASHSAHRYYHSQCTKPPGSPRPLSRAMAHAARQETPEAARHPALSSFLQDKLQRERRAEGERLAYSTSLSRADMSASVDISRAMPSSPFRPPESLGARPQSSAGVELARKKRGVGVNEMEQVISNLHKQNFDLKLELFHRRERQTALEEHVEALEMHKKKTDDVNDRLMEELERRDKAVEEAVAMIVMLEAKVGQLVQERSMVQRVESEGFFCPKDYDLAHRNPALGSDIAKLDDDAKVVVRMPSFLSEHSENTDNLRNVYLGVRGSALSLPRVAEGPSDADQTPNQALASPTLSVLSESSFVSVYGQRDGDEDERQQAPPGHVDDPLTLDGIDGGSFHEQDTMMPRRRAASASRVVGAFQPPPRSSTAVPFQSLTSVIGHESPLQRIQRLDPRGQGRDAERRQTTSTDKAPLNKEEKRDALRRVLTDGPGGARLHDQGFPPTPDTISTSTLHRFKNSNETLSPEQDADGAVLHPGAQEVRPSEAAGGHHGHTKASGEARHAGHSTHAAHRRQCDRRPQSARERSVSRGRGNDWDSESDSDSSDARSLESSLDIWLRESTKPARSGGRVSPDLFSFPTNAAKGAWAVESTFGGVQAGGASIGPGSGHEHVRVQDLFALRPELFPWSSGPPPPNRRSSLHAQTGSTSESMVPAASGASAGEGRKKSSGSRQRQGRRKSEGAQKRFDVQTDVQQQAPTSQPSGDPKRYPPISGQQQGARAGLNRLFRRSLGGGPSSSSPAAPESAPSTSTPEAGDPARDHVPMGVPSWVHRNGAADDDRSGATPPPIVLSPRQARRSVTDADSLAEPVAVAEPTDAPNAPHVQDDAGNGKAPSGQPSQENRSVTGSGSSTGSRRKWLPVFGRTNGTKSRTG